jgi:hypothetical protein
MTLKECIIDFELIHEKHKENVLKWLSEALEINENDDVTNRIIKHIHDCHYEQSENDMFDWLHNNNDYESPSTIHNAPWVTELDNVLVLEDGSCYYWYDIYNFDTSRN